ncbi:dioxygenase family protein [Parachitinimonas caeni]|uniref:Class III extradiol ring-cleavage dioxygenase n=1 Tax=Parachitinimonas caeni TaxID=3031301 RepID=A0ABT7DZ82_9NEIS|nr:class III extradiol ring-cleavage dioxygenase [Parachitinimonas caeni]MDK2125373.1 class III extradiol ring-cleavage dioxygenase [Parachitinimonas caeni]
MARIPALFVSHGAPTLPLDGIPARDFLEGAAAQWPRPTAIVVVSAHAAGRGVWVGRSAHHTAWHDFSGFPEALNDLHYDCPGDPELADFLIGHLRESGIQAGAQTDVRLDHGVWVPLLLMYPDAKVPVVTVSLDLGRSDGAQVELGRLLATLRDQQVLVMGSGSLTHNLREVWSHQINDAPEAYALEFADWVEATLAAGDVEAIKDWRQQAPHAQRCHPTPEHFLPLLVALGAGDSGRGLALHRSFSFGVLAMDAYAFD